MIKVSVVIPIYNGENYLRQCLDSVCNQTLREIEIICVDDGSTDSSYEILQEYKEKDARIEVYQQQNLYAGAARNLGKKHATGEYLVFWDCDDFFELDALEVMYEKAHRLGADMCVCGVNKYFNDTGKMALNASGYLNKKYISGDVFNRTTNEKYIFNFTNAVPWNKMFQRQFIENIALDFGLVRNGNDIYFTQCAIVQAERITTVKKALINYRLNQSESLFGTLVKSPLVPFGEWIRVAERLEELQLFPEQSFVNKVIGSIVYLLRNMQDTAAIIDTVQYIKGEGAEKLHLKVREEEFYYAKWHCEFINHLLSDSVEDFRTYLAHCTYMQLQERSAEKTIQVLKVKEREKEINRLLKIERKQEEEVKCLRKEKEKSEKQISDLKRNCEKYEKELDKIRNSWSFKIGKILMWIPGKLKRIIK